LAQVPLHSAPRSQLTWHGGLWQTNAQLEAGPQSHEPFAQSAVHEVPSPEHSTLHGGDPHGISQSRPSVQ
jgi:hypothetical protein